MAKSRRKQVAALHAEERQSAAPLSPPPPRDQELLISAFSKNTEPPAEASWASSPFQAGTHCAVADTSLCSPWPADDTDSDCNSWVEVRKQRVVIIIPPLPEAKPYPSSIATSPHLCRESSGGAPRKNRADPKCEGRRMTSRDAPPISSMDILLASALGMDGTPLREARSERIDMIAPRSQEEASLDTADSSIQPKGPAAHAKMKKAALHVHCKPADSFKSEPVGKPKVADHSEHALSPLTRAYKRRWTDSLSQLSINQSLRIVTLKKHLERAGGLKGWLCSVGLDQFKETFGKRSWSEGELLELSMEDLRHMGRTAVGPRRKLIWAIRHSSQQIM